MGMFDGLYDEDDNEWQTRAFDCILAEYKIGDKMPRSNFPEPYPHTYQVEVLGGPDENPYTDSYANVEVDVLVSVDEPRDLSLPLINYGGHLAAEGS